MTLLFTAATGVRYQRKSATLHSSVRFITYGCFCGRVGQHVLLAHKVLVELSWC